MKPRSRNVGRGLLGSEGGFTLIELMVASLVMIVALGVLLSFLRRDERAREISNHVIESRQNARSALDFIVSEIRMAGSGISVPVMTSDAYGEPIKLYPVTPDSIDGRYEKFTLVEKSSDVETVLNSAMAAAGSTIHVADTSGFAQGDLIAVTNGSFADLFEVTNVDGTHKNLEHNASVPYNQVAGHTPWPPGGYAQGSRVVKMNVITYYVDRGDPDCATIVRKEGIEEGRVISEYVNTMQLQYELTDHTVVTIPPDPMLIRNVIVTIEAASDEPNGLHVTRLVSSAKPRCM